jgi:acyl-CoA synthetase (AMP-forming)/AMP-acid ligase II
VSETGTLPFDDFLELHRHAAQTPEALALTAPGRKPLTYRELFDHLKTVHCALRGAGFHSGEVAALAMPNGPELITAFLAISSIGAGAPINPALTESEFRFYLSRLGPRVLILPHPAPSPPALAAQSLGVKVLTVHSTVVDPAGIFALQVTENGPPPFSVRTTDAALLLFTSATTATPKLVPLTREDLRAMALRHTLPLRVGAADRFLSLMPLFHHYGLVAVLAQLLSGGVVIATPGFHPGSFLALLDEFRPTWFTSNPTLNRSILELARRDPEVFRRVPLRLIRCTGTAQTEALTLLEQAVGVPVLAGYGLTETGVVTLCTPDARKPASVGRTTGLEVAIMDPLGSFLGAELEGEIVVRGRSVTSGYLDSPEANRAAFRHGWFHTGDIGHLDSDGYLFITGRLKEMISRGGEKIIPQEVDDALAHHPAVAEAAVFAVAHPTLGEDLAAAVVLRCGAASSELELRRFLAARLAPFKIPRRILFVDALPRTATGKPLRTILAEESDRAQEPIEWATPPESPRVTNT